MTQRYITTGQQLWWNGAALVPVTEAFDVGASAGSEHGGNAAAEIVRARPVDFPAAFSGSCRCHPCRVSLATFAGARGR